MKGVWLVTKSATKNIGKLRKETTGERIFDVFNALFLICLAILMMYPIWHVICASLSDSSIISLKNSAFIFPLKSDGSFGISFEAYKSMLRHPLILSSYFNSIFILVAGTAFSVLMTAVCAYVLSTEGPILKKPLTLFVMFTMFFHGGMIPQYLVNTKLLGLYDNILVLILPMGISVYNMVIMRTNFEGIPKELKEAARIDGAGNLTILFRIILPLSKAIIAVMILYYGVSYWNAWFQASIYLKDRAKFPLQLVLREILIQNDTSSMTAGGAALDSGAANIGETIKYATIVFATIPILCVYPFLQKYFTKGVMVGAVKG